MITLCIAEKPHVAKAIAAHLWPKGDYQKNYQGKSANGWFEKDGFQVSWSYGHILGLVNPEEYDPKWEKWQELPVFPNEFKVKPKADSIEQFKILEKLLKSADCVINAGDPDREGQLLIDEILELCKYKGEVKRILINATDETTIARAFEHLEDNNKYKNLYLAGLAREQADWLIGMNLTRAYSVNTRKYGYQSSWNIGRVKTPTLALIVNREKEIKNFNKVKFYEMYATFHKDMSSFRLKFIPDDTIPTDTEGRITNSSTLTSIQMKLTNKQGIVTKAKIKPGIKFPPLPYALSDLQIEANKKEHFSPKQTLDIVQQLYEKKIVSYPRSDCNYIPTAQRTDATRILASMRASGFNENDINKANLDINSKCWNDEKISAHHAIIPTGVDLPADASDDEKKIYKMIAFRYLLQFFSPVEFKTLNIEVNVCDEIFKGSLKKTINYGYKTIAGYGQEDNEEPEFTGVFPEIQEGDNIGSITNFNIESKETTPPKRFTEGTLVNAMTNIHRFLPANSPYREKLKEVKGIGTQATRANIIADLMATKRNGRLVEPLICVKKNYLFPTDFGTRIIEQIMPMLIDPSYTAKMEIELAKINEGVLNIDVYLDDVKTLILNNITYAEQHEFPLKDFENLVIKTIKCPICGDELQRKYSPKTEKYFWVCANRECVTPKTLKTNYYEDDGKNPILDTCIECGHPLKRINGKYGYFWSCGQCKATYKDKDSKPDLTPKTRKDEK